MKLANCSECGKIFKSNGDDICPDCVVLEGEDLDRVKAFLRDNRLAGIAEVSEATGVDESKIVKFVKDNRLVVTSPIPGVELECERCGKPILGGRFCSVCANSLKSTFKDAKFEDERPSGQGMLSRDLINRQGK
ncbi:MAG: MerR family transcriptional regulator [Actinomycetota bacterium]|nr:MerR family transcriptional regulator [Actinomycetota bacterium]